MISFAGGLPNPRSFPVDEIAAAASKVLKAHGDKVLQYSTTEGYTASSRIYSQKLLSERV
jgi:2-aminoadipate transaminase